MNLKKAKKADLEKRRGVFFRIGLVLSITMALFAFEWAETEKQITVMSTSGSTDITEEMVPVTIMEKEKPLKPKVRNVITEIEVVDPDIEVNEGPDITVLEDTNFVITYEPEIKDEPLEVIPIFAVEQKPLFGNGDSDLMSYIANNLEYSQEAVQMDIAGTVYVDFIISETGKVKNVTLRRGVHPLIDDSALEVIKNMPKWKPGKMNGTKVPVSFTIPIKFKID